MRKVSKKTLVILFGLLLLIFFPKKVNAKYLNITAPSDGTPGSTVNVSIATDCIGRFNVSVSNGSLKGESKYWLEASSASFAVTLGESGNTKITVTPANPVSFERKDTELSAQSKSINIKSSEVASNAGGTSTNNSGSTTNSGDSKKQEKTVKMITTSPVDFTGFKANSKGPYRVTVENDVKQLSITVKYSDNSKNTVTKNLIEGSNNIKIEGYSIIAIRKSNEKTETVPNTVDKEEKKEEKEDEKIPLRLENIVLDDKLNVKLNPNFNSEVFEYNVILENENSNLEKLLITAMANNENATVTIDGNENLINGDNIVTITVEAEGYETVWYRIKIIKKEVENTNIANEENIENSNFDDNKLLIKKIIISVLVIVIVMIGIIYIAKDCYEGSNKKGKRSKGNSSAWEDEPLIDQGSFIEDDDEQKQEEIEDMEKIKNEFFNSEKIEFEEKVKKSRVEKRNSRHKKGKHA